MASVSFENVSKTYPNGHRALIDLNLNIENGELMVFVGPSGCGKSTLLRLLAGLEATTGGRILIGDKPANHLSPQQRNIAMVFQDYALYPNMSVRGNLEFPLKMRKCPRAEIRRRAETVADMLDIVDLLERLPRQLSGGQRQRVAMGRALVREPAVFLMDEPLSNLDAKLRVQMRIEIAELQKRVGATMVYVTHDQIEAMTLGHRIAVLNQGRLQQLDSPERLYERPANTFVASFIGNPPMNLFPTHLSIGAEELPKIQLGDQWLSASLVEIPRPHLQAWDGKPVTCGIRPEAFHLSEAADNVLVAQTARVEYLGHESLLYFSPASEAIHPEPRLLVARLPGTQKFRQGQKLRLHVTPNDISVFLEHDLSL